MASKKSLIRLHKWKVDEAQLTLSQLYARHADLCQAQEELEASVLIEQAKSEDMEQGHFLYQAFIHSILTRREIISQHLAELQDEIQAALEVVRAAFRELKKYEIVEEAEITRQRKAAGLKSQAELDEIAVTGHMRKSS